MKWWSQRGRSLSSLALFSEEGARRAGDAALAFFSEETGCRGDDALTDVRLRCTISFSDASNLDGRYNDIYNR